MEEFSDSASDIEEQIEDLTFKIDMYNLDVDELTNEWEELKIKRQELERKYDKETFLLAQLEYLVEMFVLDIQIDLKRTVLRIVLTQVKYLYTKMRELCEQFGPNSVYSLYKF